MISSRSNPAIKRIRALRSRKDRDESGTFWIEGIRIVGEAAELQAPIETLVVAPDLLGSDFARSTVRTIEESGISVLQVSADVFRSISLKDGPQGIGAVVAQHWSTLDSIRPEAGLCWIALESVQDPGNLGTILRTSDAVGAPGVILLGPSTDPYDPSTIRGSMGAIFSQTLVRASFDGLLSWAERHDVKVLGTSDAAEADYATVTFPAPMVLLMGSERQGLSPARQARCHGMLRIPMVGRSDSLNLAVATSIVLYAVFNQRRRGGDMPIAATGNEPAIS